MSDVRINLVCCTQTICNEIAQGVTQKSVALTYAMAMKSQLQGDDAPDWPTINQAILERWSFNGLVRVKKRAHDILSGKVQP